MLIVRSTFRLYTDLQSTPMSSYRSGNPAFVGICVNVCFCNQCWESRIQMEVNILCLFVCTCLNNSAHVLCLLMQHRLIVRIGVVRTFSAPSESDWLVIFQALKHLRNDQLGLEIIVFVHIEFEDIHLDCVHFIAGDFVGCIVELQQCNEYILLCVSL